MIVFLISAAIVIIDQLTKMWVVNSGIKDLVVIDGFFHIRYAENTGMAWSLLSGQQVFLSLIAAVVIGGMIWYLITRKTDLLTKVTLAFMIGGAAGNLIDRLFLNYVRDFLDFYIFGYDFPIFNVADMALTIGCIMLIIASFIEEKKNDKTELAD